MNISDFLEYPFLQMALVAIILLSLCTGLLSPVIISKGHAFMGASISHASLLGISISLGLFGQASNPPQPLSLFLTTLAITTLLSLLLAYFTFRQSLPNEGAIGIFLSASMGLGVIIHQSFAREQGDLLHYLFGNVLLLTSFDIILLAILTCTVFALLYFLRYQWPLYLIDEESAAVQGIKTHFFHYGFMALLTVIIVSSVKLAGVILINSFLLVPGIFALKTAPSIKKTFIYAPSFALTTGILGLILANAWELPVSASLAVFQLLALGIGLQIFKTVSKKPAVFKH